MRKGMVILGLLVVLGGYRIAVTAYPHANPFKAYIPFFLTAGIPFVLDGLITLFIGLSTFGDEEPSSWWWLVPLYFGIIGGIIGYLKIEDRDKDMANDILNFGIIWTIFKVAFFLVGALFTYF